MNGIKHLYVGDTNSMNVLVIRDMDTDTAAVVEWDLSDDEIKEIAAKFATNQNNTSWYADAPKWEDWGTLRDSLNSFLMINDYLERYCQTTERHTKKEDTMIKMYIEFNNGNNGLLLTDETYNCWIYVDASEIVPDISEEETAAENVRNAIENGDLYSAEDLWEECDWEEHHIADYDGMTLEDIDKAVNYEDGMPKGHDHLTWERIQ